LGSSGLASSAQVIGAGRRSTSDRRHARSQNGLVVLQVALALVMLVSAGLLVRSLANLRGAHSGFNAEHLLTATINLPQSDYPTPERWLAFNSELLDRVRALPGIDAAALGVSVPFLGSPVALPFEIDGRPPVDTAPRMTDVAFASDGFFKAMQISIVRGREFVATDRRESLRVAVVNQTFHEALLRGPRHDWAADPCESAKGRLGRDRRHRRRYGADIARDAAAGAAVHAVRATAVLDHELRGAHVARAPDGGARAAEGRRSDWSRGSRACRRAHERPAASCVVQ
jgi:hypothetical protein